MFRSHSISKFLPLPFLLFAAIADVYADDSVICISHTGINDYIPLQALDSICFSADRSAMLVQPIGGGGPLSIPRSEITGICYLPADSVPANVCVLYDGASATVHNPYFISGVQARVSGADVVITNSNTSTEYTLELSGATSAGSFTYEGEYKTTIELNGVNIKSTIGAAIDIECGKRVNLYIRKGTENNLADATGGSQKAALYCKGHLEIDKAGTLNVTGNTNHAISAKEYIQLKKSAGTINILGAKNDGIHCGQYFYAKGYAVNISNIAGDGIQAEAKPLDDDEVYEEDYENGSVQIADITLGIASAGGDEEDSSSCLKADSSISVTGGDITLSNSGVTSKSIKAVDVNLLAGKLNMKATGAGAKCVKADGKLVIGAEGEQGPDIVATTTGARSGSSSGNTNTGGWGRPGGRPGQPGGNQQNSTGSSSKALKATGQITINSGTLTVSTATNGAEGMESKTGVLIKGGNNYFKCYDDCINSSGIINFAGGNTVCYATNNDAVDSNYGRSGAITISGGNVFAYTSAGSPEEGLDCDNNSYITVTGGIAVSAGGSQGGGGMWGGSSSQSVGSATQNYYLGASPSSYSSSNYYTLYNTSGQAICTYKFEGNVSNTLSLLTAPNLGKGSATVKSGTSAPSVSSVQVSNASGAGVFFIAPTVTANTTAATVSTK